MPEWRRKYRVELRRERDYQRLRRLNPIRPALLALLCATVLALVLVGGSPRRQAVRASEVMWAMPWLLIALFLVLYAVQVVLGWGTRSGSGLRICPRCFELQAPNPANRCPCGAVLEDESLWTRNKCHQCGYDLRGSSEKCSECGTKVPKA